MLILTRHVTERILIGTDIYITICGVKGGQVRIGIEAPPEINIVRTELLPKDDTTNTTLPPIS